MPDTLHHATDYREHRAAAGEGYPPPGDALDAIFKGFVAIRDSGLVALPPDTLAWLAACEAVKARFKKD